MNSRQALYNVINGYGPSSPYGDGCKLTNRELASEVGVCEKTVSRALRSLQEQDAIKVGYTVNTGKRVIYPRTHPDEVI